MNDFIKNLQEKPYETRVKILWGTVGVVAIIILAVWVITLKANIKNLDGKNLLSTPATTSINQSPSNFASVERAEISGQNLKLYFNFNNPTSDILNVSKNSDISLDIDGKQETPTQMTDRQGQPFVQKVLSKTQNFGILVFPAPRDSSGKLTFNQIFFEQTPSQIFNQTIDLDLKKLEQDSNLRN